MIAPTARDGKALAITKTVMVDIRTGVDKCGRAPQFTYKLEKSQ
jgi:hypothetical protein